MHGLKGLLWKAHRPLPHIEWTRFFGLPRGSLRPNYPPNLWG